MENEPGGFSAYIWKFVDGKPVQNCHETMKQVPTQTPMSEALSKDLKKRGFTFCGPTIVYAFAQAVGMVNDHMTDCFRHKECAKLAKRLERHRVFACPHAQSSACLQPVAAPKHLAVDDERRRTDQAKRHGLVGLRAERVFRLLRLARPA